MSLDLTNTQPIPYKATSAVTQRLIPSLADEERTTPFVASVEVGWPVASVDAHPKSDWIAVGSAQNTVLSFAEQRQEDAR